jgi:hypothetical protein
MRLRLASSGGRVHHRVWPVPIDVARVERAAGEQPNGEWLQYIDVDLLEVGTHSARAGLVYAFTSFDLDQGIPLIIG